MNRRKHLPAMLIAVFAAVSFPASEHLISGTCLRGTAACAAARLWASLLAASAGAGPADASAEDAAALLGAREPDSESALEQRTPVRHRDVREHRGRTTSTLVVREDLPGTTSQPSTHDFGGSSCRSVQRVPSGPGGHLSVG